MAIDKVRIQVTSDDKPLDGTIDKLVKMGVVDQKNADQFKKNNKQTREEAEKTTGGFGKMENAINTIGKRIVAAFAIERMVSFTKEAVLLAGKMEGVERAFNHLNRPGLLNELRKATRGTVNDLELMQQAVRANNFQIPLNNLAGLFDFARRRAKETGESVDFLVNSIVLGIGRKSPLILDNLGISAVRLREKLKGVGTETATIADITKSVGEIVAEEQAKAGKEIDSTGDAIQRLDANWTNFKIQFGQAFAPLVGSVLDELNKKLDTFNKSEGFTESFLALFGNPIIQAQLNLEKMKNETEEYFNALSETEKEINKVNKAIERESKFLGFSNAATKKVIELKEKLAELQAKLAKEQGKEAAATDISANSINNLKAEIEALVKIRNDAAIGSKTFNDAQAEIIRIEKELEAATAKLEATTKKANTALEDRIKLIREQGAAQKELDQSTKTAEDKQADVADQQLQVILDGLEKKKSATEKTNEDIEKDIDEAHEKHLKQIADEDAADKKAADDKKARQQALFDLTAQFAETLEQLRNNSLERDIQAIEEERDAKLKSLEDQLEGSNLSAKQRAGLEKRVADQRKQIEESSAKEIAEIRKKQAETSKALALFNIALSTAEGITKTIATLGFPAATPFVAIAAAIGGLQLAAAASQPIPAFKEGVLDFKGKGTGTSDSNLARISHGESVTPADKTKKYYDPLKAIHQDMFEDLYVPRAVLQAEQKSFAQNLAASAKMQQYFNMDEFGEGMAHLFKGIKRNDDRNVSKIVGAILKEKNDEIRFKRRWS